MKRILLAVLLLSAMALAAESDLTEGTWIYSSNIFGSGPDEITPTLNYDGELRLTLDSSAKSRAFWKLTTVFDTPTTASYDLEFDVRVNAPGVDLDYNHNFGSGEQTDNDGPNLFAFAYDYNEATMTDIPISVTSLSFYDKKRSLCHMHMECNWMGDPENAYGFYCSSEENAAGWVYDAQSFGSAVKVNEVTAEAFQDDGWKKIRLNMDGGECNTNKTTLMLMAVDAFADYPYTWEIKNFRMVTSETIPLPIDYIYDYDGGAYTRIAKPVYCGDGIMEGSEECDVEDGVSVGWTCTSSCNLKNTCGDNILVGDELCDGSIVTTGFTCSSTCAEELPVCGDNMIVADEVCDGNATVTGFACSSDCKTMSTICGDNLVVGAEECDGVMGVDEEHGCTHECSLYRLLTEEEQEGLDALVALIESSEEGVPATAELDLSAGIYTAKDLEDQFVLANKTLDGNVSFCAAGVTDCEARYIFVEEAVATELGISPDEQLKGVAKVYKTEVNGTVTYFVGFKGGVGWLPYIEMDTTMWLIVGALVFLVVVAGIVLLLILGGFAYISKKHGFQLRRIFK
ncbi:hypothetical protein ACFLQ2_00375 [archaeon]